MTCIRLEFSDPAPQPVQVYCGRLCFLNTKLPVIAGCSGFLFS